ncbi:MULTISPECIES: TIGR00297 family protein [unclassified Prochlorococcus]|uniref:TIGR00297 family protein n=1 Tax=unclassified Prochlorococcus TaxID=2627481 RepID=UPI000533AAB4|nr:MULTISPECIES: TIGR00297 family protein [unclassified Prochlorococcus]KGG15348.1 hypothetical protein EV06_1219 [Prochlorococcus sp. MIT 0602]KGG17626.1 hypothetical protein EV07_1066 [Prochlorococcus sp. MIT 0603]
MPSIYNSWAWAFCINFLIIAIAQRFPFLTNTGWLHAGILGTILLACLGWSGWFAVALYLLLGTLVTKIGFSYKKSRGIAEGRGGRRGPENVWGSAATGAILAIAYQLFSGYGEYFIFIGFSSSFSAKLADTFGSEIGKRYGRKTFLITNLKRAKAGTDGAISLEGTYASFFGSLIMGLVMFLLSFINSLQSLFIVITSGFIATIMESYFGAVFQQRISWLTNEVVNFIQTLFAALLSMLIAILLININ